MKLKEFINSNVWVRINYDIFYIQKKRMQLADYKYGDCPFKITTQLEFRDIYLDEDGWRYLGEW